MDAPIQSPLSIYVLFHQASEQGRKLAHDLHDWFRLKTDDGERSESGLPVWFRSVLTEAAEDVQQITPPIDWKGAESNVVVVLADRHMVADRGWRYALHALTKPAKTKGRKTTSRNRLVLPVEVDPALHQLRFLTTDRNALRIGPPLPEGLTEKRDADRWKTELQRRARLLRRAVTEAIARQFVFERGTDDAPGRLSVFLSHAKRDGRQIAERLRDSLASYSQLDVWYDATDLPAGHAWRKPMTTAAGELAALVSVVTDAYPTRPWCRKEIETARRPHCLPGTSPHTSIWQVQPTVAVHAAGAHWSRAMAHLVHVPAIGWGDETAVPDRIADIVDRLVLEVMVTSFHRRLATHWVAERAKQLADGGRHVALLTWVPEPWTLVMVLRELVRKNAGKRAFTELVVVYPGHGLRPGEHVELQEIAESLAELAAGSDKKSRLAVRLVSHERLDRFLASRTPAKPETRDQPFRVCLSGGGSNAELASAGLGMPHVDDLFVRLARRLLESGARIVYGGTLGKLDNNLTEALIEAARGWMRDQSLDDAGEVDPQQLDDVPFTNYSAWPMSKKIELRHQADLVGMCTFKGVEPPRPLDDDPSRDDETIEKLRTAEALEAMRRLTSNAEEIPLRIVVAGKIAGYSGFLPGIAEEALWAIQEGQILVVLGGFGGCAALLADYLRTPKSPWPDELTLERCIAEKQLDAPWVSPELLAEHEPRFAALRQQLDRYRAELHGPLQRSRFSVGRKSTGAKDLRQQVLALLHESSPTRVVQEVGELVDHLARR